MTYKRLGDLLVSVGLIGEDQLQQALQLQKGSNKRLGTVLIESGVITEQQMLETLEMQLGLDFVDLSKTLISPEMAHLLPKNIAKRYGVVPIKLVKDELFLAMSDPLNFVALEDVKSATRKRVVPMIATNSAVERAIAALYGNEGAARAIEEMKWESGARVQAVPFSTTVLDEDTNSAPTVRLVNSIIERAAAERASDIHLEPRGKEMVVRMRIDGLLRVILTVPKQLQSSVVSRLKIMGSMDIAERRVPLDGRANVRIKNSDIDLRISTLPTIFGEKVVIRLLDKSAQLLDATAIGLTGDNLEKYNALLGNSSGVVLIVGPTGSGKSSTMYTMIRQLNLEEVNLVTLEDPVEFNTDGVNQCQVNEKTGMTFAAGLRSILRQDPDIIVVGEIRDGETAEIAMRAAITGHLVLSTIHTNDSIATVDRLLDMGVEPYLISTALKGVIAQRLVKRICPRCKEAYTPTEEECGLTGIPNRPGLQFFRGRGCNECFHTGYRGRAAVFEILLIDNNVRKLIGAKADRDQILANLQGTTFLSLSDYSRKLVLEGVTTPREAARTIYSTVAEA